VTQSPELDIVLYGATGFTGRFVAEHLAALSERQTWAIAGRDKAKLETLREEIGKPNLPIIVVDAEDHAGLARMVRSSRLVLATAGPFNLYCSGVVAACAEAGTDYADITGDPLWSRQMIDQHQATARANGARIVLSAGFDSIPSELGVLLLQKEAVRRWGAPLKHVCGRVRHFGLKTYSGGSIASAKARADMLTKDPSLQTLSLSAFALTPGFEGPSQPDTKSVRLDETLGAWLTPFVMASINSKNVHRSNYLQDHPYGETFLYEEMEVVGRGEDGKRKAEELAKGKPGGGATLKPGEGPSREECEAGSFDMLYYGRSENGELIKLAVKGNRDPGYAGTARMLAETGLLLLDRPDKPGGFWLAGAALGEELATRLTARAGMSFQFEN